jgi:hypothetical protein
VHRVPRDFYAPDCGPYVESRRLPFRTHAIAGNADLLVALVEDPVPHLTVLRWKSRAP